MMQVIRVPSWSFSLLFIDHHGWHFCAHVGPWLIFFLPKGMTDLIALALILAALGCLIFAVAWVLTLAPVLIYLLAGRTFAWVVWLVWREVYGEEE